MAVLSLLVPFLVACGGEMEEEADGDDVPISSAEAAARPMDLPNPFGERIEGWGELPGDREWGNVSAVHDGPDGQRIWVAERCGANSCLGSDVDPVLEFDPDGNVQGSFGADLFVRPHGIFVDDEGNVWIADDQGADEDDLVEFPDADDKGHRVIKFSPEGEILMTLGTPGEAGDPPTHLTRPSDVVVADNGDIFVAEGHSNDTPPARISKFSSDGTFIESWGTLGSEPGQFRTAHALALDTQGRLFVADRGNNRIQIFSQDGEFLDAWDQFGRPNDVFIDENDVMYVVDAQSDEETNPGMRRGVYIGITDDGEVTAFLPADPEYNPSGSEGLALDEDGHLYVGEIGVPGMTKYLRE
ncbi:MAG: peptidyl-alpha-hydroxyglycine alpha-amidating lyase family protein [Gemmatimonadota bacterium]